MADDFSYIPEGGVPESSKPRDRLQVVVRPGEPKPPTQAEGSGTSWASKLFEPITSYPETQVRVSKEAREQMGQGVEQLKQGEIGGGLWNTGFGAMRYLGSPIESALHTVVGKPMEENFGIPHEYSEFAAGLAIPYYGLRGGAKPAPGASPNTFNKIFRPESVADPAGLPGGAEAAAAIRSETGPAARSTEVATTALEPHYPTVTNMTPADRLNLFDHMEGLPSSPLPPEQQKLANTLRTTFQDREAQLRLLPGNAQRQFVEDYFPHMWKDPNAAAQFVQNWGSGVSKQGSGASLRTRSVPTIADGLRAGLELVSDNPIDVATRYVTSIDRYIAAEHVREGAEAQGIILRGKPQIAGASGTPTQPAAPAKNIPPGYVPLNGRGAVDDLGRQAYAPEHWARVYNNYISRGFAEYNKDLGNVMDTLRRGSNAVTGLELALSGYHALTMMQEAAVNKVSEAILAGVKGDIKTAAKNVLQAPTAFVSTARRGGKGQDIYLGKTAGSSEDRELVDLLTQAGGRFVGKRHALDVDFEKTGAGSYWTAWKRGALQSQVRADITTMGSGTAPEKVKTIFKHVGRAMETMTQPLFQVYIPKLKSGAAMENMAQWLQLHPNATQGEKMQAAREIVDSIDNRFGEMIQDNIFWDHMLKQSAMLMMRSYSWNLGTVREIGGGVKDVLAPKSAELSRRTAYNIALPIVYGTMAGIYQTLKTGEPPKDLHDLAAPRTGGTTDRGMPERVILPGYMKDVFGWAQDPKGELENKVATAPKTAVDLWRNKDWRGRPIAPQGEPWLQAYVMYALKAMQPISTKTRTFPQTNLSRPERIMGMQPGGMRYTDPQGYKRMIEHIERGKAIKLKKQQAKERQRYGGTE